MASDRADRRLWPVRWPTSAFLQSPLQDILLASASRHSDGPCLVYQGRRISYAEVAESSSRFASALLSLGARTGDRIGLYLPNIPQFVIAYFGILMAGCTVVPCSPLYKERELEYQLRDAECSMVVAAEDIVKGDDLFASLELCRARLPLRRVITTSVTDYLPALERPLAGLAGVKRKARGGTVDFRRLVAGSRPMAEAVKVNATRDVAVLQYTGGTTGISKGAMLSHFNLYSNAVMTASVLRSHRKTWPSGHYHSFTSMA